MKPLRPGNIIKLFGSAFPDGLRCEVMAVDDTGKAIKIKALSHNPRLGAIGFMYESESLKASLLALPGFGDWIAIDWDFSMN